MLSLPTFEQLGKRPDFYFPLLVISEKAKETDRGNISASRLSVQTAGRTISFEMVFVASGILKDIELGILKAATMKTGEGRYPMVVVPFISKKVQVLLQEQGVSGIDLSGNYYIITPEMTAIRLDQKNRFKVKRVIQNIYSRNSSIAVRWLMTKKTVENNLLQIKSGMDDAGSTLSLGTISKVLKTLEEDVFLLRTKEEIKLLKPDELLTLLKNEYRKPPVLSEYKIRIPEDRTEARKILNKILGENTWIWSGVSSAERYASTVPQSTTIVYTKNDPENTGITGLADMRFYNCTVQYIKEPVVYFDANYNYASPIQSYIELALLDKREQEIAEDIKREILNEARNN